MRGLDFAQRKKQKFFKGVTNFIKTKSNDDAVSAKEKCLTELELLGQRLENI